MTDSRTSCRRTRSFGHHVRRPAQQIYGEQRNPPRSRRTRSYVGYGDARVRFFFSLPQSGIMQHLLPAPARLASRQCIPIRFLSDFSFIFTNNHLIHFNYCYSYLMKSSMRSKLYLII